MWANLDKNVWQMLSEYHLKDELLLIIIRCDHVWLILIWYYLVYKMYVLMIQMAKKLHLRLLLLILLVNIVTFSVGGA